MTTRFLGMISLVALAACGTSSSGGSSGGTTGTTGSTGTTGTSGSTGSCAITMIPDAGCGDNQAGTGGSCFTAEPGGCWIQEVQVADTLPAPAGGTPVDGTYDLTSRTAYTGAGGATGPDGQYSKHTLILAGGGLQEAQQNGSCAVERTSGTLTFSGAMVTYAQTCPVCSGNNCGGMAAYSATSTAFTLYTTDNGKSRADVFTKR